jgi:hypothetical protein
MFVIGSIVKQDTNKSVEFMINEEKKKTVLFKKKWQ